MKRLVCGPRAVTETLSSSPKAVHLLLLEAKGRHTPSLLELAEKRRVTCRLCGRAELDQLAKKLPHQGAIAITGDFSYLDLEGLLDRCLGRSPTPLLVALDQVQDVQNVGSLLRSSVALGADGLLLCRHSAAPVSPATVRVSAGASEHAAVARVTNLARSIDRLHDLGFVAVGLDADAEVALDQVDLTGATALVLGSESSGLRRLVAQRCDQLAAIALPGPIASLNVAVAGALALYEASRQRPKNQ